MTRTTRLSAVFALALVTAPLTASGRQASAPQLVDAVQLRAAHARVVSSIGAQPRQISLAELLRQSMLVSSPGHPAAIIDSHRATLLVIACFVNNWSLAGLVPEARDWPRLPRGRVVVLHGRHDLAQHFIVTAALTATTGSPFADAVAVLKEVRDSQRGSGFSFSDLAASRAGTLFGQMATGSPDSAARILTRLSAPLTDDDIMPGTRGLPDNLSDAEFARRIGGVGSQAYHALVSDIDRRIAALEFYRPRTN